MSWLARLRILSPRVRRELEREMQEELAALEGLAGRKELGNLTRAAENARAVWGLGWLAGLAGDLRYTVRTLRRDRAFTAVAVVSLALCIGANVAVFNLADEVLWRELPVRDPQRLVTFENSSRSYFGFTEFAKHRRAALEAVFATSIPEEVEVGSGQDKRKAQLALVSGNYFEGLGVGAAAGRVIQSYDDQRDDPARVAVLAYSFWQRKYNGDTSVVGRSLWIGAGKFSIIGVAPPEFFGVSVGEAADVWIPVTAQPTVFAGKNWLAARNDNFLTILGRLASGVSRKRAEEMLAPVSYAIDLERNGPPPNEAGRKAMLESKLVLEDSAKGLSYLRTRFSKPLRVVFGLVLGAVLLAAVNIASLQLARADERRKEIAVRLAIGASRFRIARQLLTESFVITAVSAMAGLLIYKPIAWGLVSLMTVWGNEPARLNLPEGSRVLLFVLAVGMAVTLLSGMLPVLHATRRDLAPGLQQTAVGWRAGRRAWPGGRLLTTLHLALSLVLVTGTCLFGYSLHRLRHFDGGMRRAGLLVFDTDPTEAGYKDRAAVQLNMRVEARLAAIPGVESVSFSQNGVFSGRNYESMVEADGFHGGKPQSGEAIYDHVGPRFFHTLGTRLLAGRDFGEGDSGTGAKTAILSRKLTRILFGAQDPLGRSIYVPGEKAREAYQIIGVVEDVRSDLRRPDPLFYLPQLQTGVQVFGTEFFVRTCLQARVALSALEHAVRAEDGRLVVQAVHTADYLLDGSISTDRFMARLGWGFGLLAITLASTGIFGVLSYEIARRKGEIGIRMAVGAQRRDIARLVIGETALACSAGLALGGFAAWALSRLVKNLIFGVAPNDPRLELSAAALLLLVAAAAAFFPARRAAHLDPMKTLRNE